MPWGTGQALTSAVLGGAAPLWPVVAPSGGDDSTGINTTIATFGGAYLKPGSTYIVNAGITMGAGQFLVGPPTAKISYTGSGDCVRQFAVSTAAVGPPRYGGILGGLVIDGSGAGAGAAGVHTGDIFQLEYDCCVQNFTGAGSIGAWFDNNYTWTEQLMGVIRANNCTTHVVFDHSADVSGSSTGSFDRLLLTVLLVTRGAGNGVVWQNGAMCFDGELGIYGKDSYGSVLHSVLTLTGQDTGGFSRYLNSILNIGVELLNPGSGVQPGTIKFGTAGSNLIVGCRGIIDFAAHVAFASASGQVNSFQFEGPIFGDTLLFRTQGGTFPFNAGSGLVNGGNISTVNDVITVNPSGNLTAMIMPKWVAGMGNPVRVTVINRSAVNSITMDVQATSNVAGGASVVIAPNTAITFWWDFFAALWYPAA